MDKQDYICKSYPYLKYLLDNIGIKLATQSFEVMQGTITRMSLSAYSPNIEIEIPRSLCGTLEFNREKEIIDYGYKKCDEIFQ